MKYKNHIIFISLTTLISLAILAVLIFPHLKRNWREHKLTQEFACPENQTLEQSEAYIEKSTAFYTENYPTMTVSNLLGIRMELLLSHHCTATLQNMGDNNNGALPDQQSVEELKSMATSTDNQTLREMFGE